jgi:hypothetical protein
MLGWLGNHSSPALMKGVRVMIEHLAHGVNSWGQQRGADRAATIFNALHGIQPAAKEVVYNKASTDKLIAELHEKAIRAQAEVEGQYAQVLALKAALQAVNSNHPLLMPSGEKYKDGSPKSGVRKFYERAFDAFMKTCGGNFALNPQAYREN